MSKSAGRVEHAEGDSVLKVIARARTLLLSPLCLADLCECAKRSLLRVTPMFSVGRTLHWCCGKNALQRRVVVLPTPCGGVEAYYPMILQILPAGDPACQAARSLSLTLVRSGLYPPGTRSMDPNELAGGV